MIDFSQFDFIQFTTEETNRLTILNASIMVNSQELTQLNNKITELEKTGSADELEAAKSALHELVHNCTEADNERKKIYEAAEERYYNRLETEQDILDDARKVLAVADKENFEQHINISEQLKRYINGTAKIIERAGGADKLTDEDKQAIENIEKSKPIRTQITYRLYLRQCTRLQFNAFKSKGLSDEPLFMLIDEQAAAAYPPTPEELTQPEPGEMLTEQQERDIIRTTRPANYSSINDAVSNAIFNPSRASTALAQFGEQSNGQLFFTGLEVLTGKKGKRNINSLLSVWYDDENLTLTKNGKPAVINDYDRAVFNAICTLYLSGTTAFTLRMLYCTITGKEIHETAIKGKTRDELVKALNKLKRTEIELNFENEAEQYTFTDENGNKVELHRFKETIINIAEADAVINGQKVHAYVINSKPKLLGYAQNKGQIITTPYKALELKISEKNTPEVIALRQFFIDEIARIKSPGQSNHITYEAIYTRVQYVKGCSELTKKQKASARDSAIMILDNFAAAKQIKAYKEMKKGQIYHHIEITPIDSETSEGQV